MKLRRLRYPCEHGRYEPHRYADGDPPVDRGLRCPGGVFLPADTLIIEKENGEWPDFLIDDLALLAHSQVRKYLDDLAEKPLDGETP